jgi:hypothetical protein
MYFLRVAARSCRCKCVCECTACLNWAKVVAQCGVMFQKGSDAVSCE